MGLLDGMFSDDPRKQALLTMGLGLLGGGGNFGQNLSRAGMASQQAYAMGLAAKDKREQEAQEREMRAMQMAQLKQAQEDQSFARQIAPNFFAPGVQPNTPVDDNGFQMPSSPAKADFAGYGQALAARNPQLGLPWIQAGAKDNTPITLAPGAKLVDRNNYRPLAENKKQDELPSGMRMGPNGPEWIPGYLEGKRNVAAAGAPKIDVKYGGNLASELGKGTAAVLTDGRTKAEAAVESIKQGHQILGVLDSGPSYTGPGAALKLKAAQIAPMFGFKPDEAGIRNTRELIVGLANQTLNARGLLKGQGQITEYEQKTLQKAKSGEVDDMTPDEIRALVRVNERASRATISSHKKIVTSLANKKEFAEAIPFFQIDEPEEYAPAAPKGQGGLSPAEEQERAALRKQLYGGR